MKELDESALVDIVMKTPVTFVTGKGGAGKTTLSSLLSKAAVSRGERVLFISLFQDTKTNEMLGIRESDAQSDIFHSRKLGCDVSVITPTSALVNYLSAKRMGPVIKRLTKTGLLDLVANVVPGMRELLVIGDIRSKSQSGNWDRIIIDSPSTGHVRNLFTVSNNTGIISQSGVIKHQSIAADEFINDSSTTQVIIATLDHAMPLSECRELIFELEDQIKMNVGAVIINKTKPNHRHSKGIDKGFSDIFLPLYFYVDENAPKHKKFLSYIKKFQKLPDILNTEIQISDQTTTCIILGSGGVGKTTTAAAVGLGKAKQGKNVALLTIDPAKRLGTALGLKDVTTTESHLDAGSMKQVSEIESNFHIFQLDAKQEFLDLLEATLNEADYKNARENTFVSAVSSMGIINEFMAIEAMHRLVTSNKYDLVVIDTPPSQHVFDLLEAPKALERMSQSNVFKTIVGAGSMASITTNVALNTIFRPLRGLVGAELVADAVEFLRTVKDVEEEFVKHSKEIIEELSLSSTNYFAVCNPTEPSREQVITLIGGMADRDFTRCDVIINGVEIDNDLEEIEPFAIRLSRFDTQTFIFEELELDDPFDIVKAMSEKVI